MYRNSFRKIRKDSNYQGSETLTFPNGNCSVNVTNTQEIHITTHFQEQERNIILTYTTSNILKSQTKHTYRHAVCCFKNYTYKT